MREINTVDLGNRYCTSLFYFSLPEFPSDCCLQLGSSLLLRDMFGCVSLNPNTNGRHYEYPKFQDFSYDIGCNSRHIPKIVENYQNKRDVYVIFRTSEKRLNSRSEQLISGYIKVSSCQRIDTQILGTKKDFLGFKGEEAVFLERRKALKSCFPKRGRVDIETRKGHYKNDFSRILQLLIEKKDTNENKFALYQEETKNYLNNLRNPTYRTRIFQTCVNCQEMCRLKNALKSSFKLTGKNYLDYIYSPKVFLTGFIEKLKELNKMEEI